MALGTFFMSIAVLPDLKNEIKSDHPMGRYRIIVTPGMVSP